MKSFDESDKHIVARAPHAIVFDGLVGFPIGFEIRDAALQELKRRRLDAVVFPKALATIVIPGVGLGADHVNVLWFLEGEAT